MSANGPHLMTDTIAVLFRVRPRSVDSIDAVLS
jgi:hypothetical protein